MTTSPAHYRAHFQQRLADQMAEREELRQQAQTAATAAILALAPTFPSLQYAFLFGSITRAGQFHPQSDVDVALEGTTAEDYFAFWRELEKALPNWVLDVRELTAADQAFANLIRQTGILLYERQNPPSAN